MRRAVDHLVDQLKAAGQQTPKVFKLTSRTVAAGGSVELEREHSFRQITTRRCHDGAHGIELQINGVSSGRADFTILPAPDIVRPRSWEPHTQPHAHFSRVENACRVEMTRTPAAMPSRCSPLGPDEHRYENLRGHSPCQRTTATSSRTGSPRPTRTTPTVISPISPTTPSLTTTSVGRVFTGQEQIAEYFVSYFIGYNTHTTLMCVDPEDGYVHVGVVFTGDLPGGRTGGVFDITFSGAKLHRVTADLLQSTPRVLFTMHGTSWSDSLRGVAVGVAGAGPLTDRQRQRIHALFTIEDDMQLEVTSASTRA